MLVILLVIPTLLIGIISYYLWIWTYWKRRGIPGPMGYPVVGVLDTLLDHHNSPWLALREWTKVYGSVYGITEGYQKTLVISDPSLINEVFVKQFDNFYGRKLNPLQGDPDKGKRVHLFASQGFRWKRIRTIASPTFSNNSLRKIHSTVEECAFEILRYIEKRNGEQMEMLTLYQEYTMDVISRIAMGQNESMMFRNPYIDDIRSIFGGNGKGLFMIAGIIPRFGLMFRSLLMKYPDIIKSPVALIFQNMEDAVRKRMEQREEDKKNGIEKGEPADFIDLFLDARADVDMLEEEHNEEFTKQNIKINRQLTLDEIVAQCFVFVAAGFDTTALSLSYTTYLLATHPNIMKKLQEEIDRECPDPSISFDQLSKLKYLDCVVKEALRVYPLGTIANSRKCMRTTKVKGIEIEEGVNVQIDTWTLHYDKKIWGEDADEFKPKRWESGEDNSHKSGYIAFGLGPRQCIGMRLTYMEEKLLLSHILRKYTFETTHNTQIPLKLIGRTTTSPESVILKLTTRY